MKSHSQNLALLPGGFVDLLGADAAREADSISALMGLFTAYGYERIKPPMAEYEDSLLAPGPGAALAGETFRLMDPESHRMLGIRADITPQISRIARSRYEDRARPLRLAYANDVLRTRGGQDRFARQFCQVGAEIIGDEGLEALIESAVLAVQGVGALGINEITLDLALPRLVDQICAAHKTPPADILDDLTQRRKTGAKGKLGAILDSLLECNGGARDVLRALKKLSLPKDSANDVKALEKTVTAIEIALEQLGVNAQITIDALERKGFDYHSGITFTLFARNVRGELGRGGRYNVHFGSEDTPPEAATGFTLYMDTIRAGLPDTAADKILAVPYKLPWGEIKRLQGEGWITLRYKEKDIPKDATHLYKEGAITARKKDI